jgi:hypothetical protein
MRLGMRLPDRSACWLSCRARSRGTSHNLGPAVRCCALVIAWTRIRWSHVGPTISRSSPRGLGHDAL